VVSRSKCAAWVVTLGCAFGLCIDGAAYAECGQQPGDWQVTITAKARAGALDMDDYVTIDATPPVPGKVIRMDVLLNGQRHPIPKSDQSKLTIRIDQIPGSRKLSFAGIPLDSGATTLEINAYDDQNHCGYGSIKENGGALQIRAAEDDFAIVIGVRKTIASSRELSHARDDAYDIAHHLIDTLHLKASNVWLLTDNRDEARKAVPGAQALQLNDPDVIYDTFETIGNSISYSSALFFYFSGHQFVLDTGNPHAEHFFLILPNSTLDVASESRLSWRRLMEKLTNLDHLDHGVVILDSCYSGGRGDDVAIYATPKVSDAAIPDLAGMKVIGSMHMTHLIRTPPPLTVGILASSTSTQPSWELRTGTHSAFTQSLLDVARAAKGHIALSLIEAIDGTGQLKGAASRTTEYVKSDYGAESLQTPTHVPDTDWMKKSGTWVP
jgi:hypothetical protein